MKYSINVPRLDWLIGGSRIGSDYNRYYGSLGTDPSKGFIGQKIFNYSVRMEKREEEEIIVACVYYGNDGYKATDKDQIAEKDFPAEEDSLPQIGEWLDAQAAAFFEDH